MLAVICGSNDPYFDDVKDLFYEHFGPDDWDYMIIGNETDRIAVEVLAEKISVFEVQMKLVNFAGAPSWVAVTYHS